MRPNLAHTEKLKRRRIVNKFKALFFNKKIFTEAVYDKLFIVLIDIRA